MRQEVAQRAAAATRRFDYYARLNGRQKAIYRQSDALSGVPLGASSVFQSLREEVRQALAKDDRVLAEAATSRLVTALCRALDIEGASVRVLASRPRGASSELHGLYVREQGKRPVITVWMRTAQLGRVVQFRTFLRTLLHEVCHHLDYALYELGDSFHTEGFFKRESSLVRILDCAPKRPTRERRPARKPSTAEVPGPLPRAPSARSKRPARSSEGVSDQLSLPFALGS